MSKILAAELASLFLKETPLIDVRAPVEFQLGSLPGAVNLPIMNDEERALVGTTYKQQGRESAIKLGHELVSGKVKDARLQQWSEQIQRHPETVIYCFRGGLRSQITQRWLAEAGFSRPVIEGGYKNARQFLMEQTDAFAEQRQLWVLSGPTGSAKTHLLKKAQAHLPILDLEALACHRGSAFGGMSISQPSQIDFENRLAVATLKISQISQNKKILIEDESRMIGKRTLPESLFVRMRESKLIYLETSFEERVENIFEDYVLKTEITGGDLPKARARYADYIQSIGFISRKLGGLRSQELILDIRHAEELFLKDPQDLAANKIWIAKLLNYYYDPLYAKSFERRKPEILMRGNAKAVLEYLQGTS